jgi:hypothetical protein
MNSKLFIILIGALFVYGWHLSIPLAAAQDAPPGDPGRRVVDTGQTSVPPTDQTVARGQGAVASPPSNHDPGQAHNTGEDVHPESRTPDSHGYLKRVNKQKDIPQSGSADVKWNTPCGSPKCLGAVSTKPSVDVFRSQVGDGAQGLKSIQGSRSLGAVQGKRR